MTHISRPFQIALAAMVLFVAVWFVALRGHSSGTEGSGSAASSSAPAPAPQASAPGAGSGSAGSSGSSSSPGTTHHGAAPGVGGLTRAIAKARDAAAESQQHAQRLAQKSEQASGSGSARSTHKGPARATHNGSQRSSAATPAATSPAKVAPSGAAKTHAGASGAAGHAKRSVPAMQAKVEGQLERGKVVAILFWNPKGAVDAVVRRELHAAGRTFGAQLAVHVARSGQVGSYGTFTRAVQVYSTPTILMINSKGVTSSVTGLKDAFSIEQAVREAKQAQ
jgi:hypothetical protein